MLCNNYIKKILNVKYSAIDIIVFEDDTFIIQVHATKGHQYRCGICGRKCKKSITFILNCSLIIKTPPYNSPNVFFNLIIYSLYSSFSLFNVSGSLAACAFSFSDAIISSSHSSISLCSSCSRSNGFTFPL